MFHRLKRELQINDNSDKENTIAISRDFWIDDKVLHKQEFKRTNGNCCFNHQIGLPKLKTPPYCEMDLFDYELDIIRKIEQKKYYALNKARGIGATELILRWILFQAILNDIPSRKFLIIPGTRGELAREHIKRTLDLCKKIASIKRKSHDRIFINKSEIIAMPADPDAIRGYENVGVIFADEAAHWDMLDDDPVLEAIEPHRTKSDAHVIIVSTPNGRRGFFANIFFNSSTKYCRDEKQWSVAEDRLIKKEEVEKIKGEDNYRYEQEYNCQFLSTRYAAFPEQVLESARQKSEEYQLNE